MILEIFQFSKCLAQILKLVPGKLSVAITNTVLRARVS